MLLDTCFSNLIDALVDDDVDSVRRLLENRVQLDDVFSEDEQEYTPLTFAAGWSSIDIVCALIDAGADVNTTECSNPPLYEAVYAGREDVVAVLLSAGAEADRHYEDHANVTALMVCAAVVRNLKILDMLIDEGADVNSVDDYGYTPLMRAASKFNFETVRHLVKRGASLTSVSTEGSTPLICAACKLEFNSFPCPKVTRAMVEMGADVNARVDDTVSTLFIVGKLGTLSTFRVLLECGADVMARGCNNMTILQTAIDEDWDAEYVKLLIEFGALGVNDDEHENDDYYIAVYGHLMSEGVCNAILSARDLRVAFLYRRLRAFVWMRIVVNYWMGLTEHLYEEGGAGRKRDMMEFVADMQL